MRQKSDYRTAMDEARQIRVQLQKLVLKLEPLAQAFGTLDAGLDKLDNILAIREAIIVLQNGEPCQLGDVIVIGNSSQGDELEYLTVEENPVGRLVVYSVEIEHDFGENGLSWVKIPYGVGAPNKNKIIQRNGKPCVYKSELGKCNV